MNGLNRRARLHQNLGPRADARFLRQRAGEHRKRTGHASFGWPTRKGLRFEFHEYIERGAQFGPPGQAVEVNWWKIGQIPENMRGTRVYAFPAGSDFVNLRATYGRQIAKSHAESQLAKEQEKRRRREVRCCQEGGRRSGQEGEVIVCAPR